MKLREYIYQNQRIDKIGLVTGIFLMSVIFPLMYIIMYRYTNINTLHPIEGSFCFVFFIGFPLIAGIFLTFEELMTLSKKFRNFMC